MGLDRSNFFNGYGEILGENSNLGFNNSKHNQYLNDENDIRDEFNQDVVELLATNPGLEHQQVDIYQNVVQMHPDYESWYRVGQWNPEEIHNH